MNAPYASRHRATVDELHDFLHMVGDALASRTQRVTGYLIGGGAMALRGLKDATKDIDLVVTSRVDRQALAEVVHQHGYRTLSADPFDVAFPREYEGFRADLHRKPGAVGLGVFQVVVMDQLHLTPTMRTRARTDTRTYGGLTLALAANEDIFIFKAVTKRPDDDLDIMILAGTGLDPSIIRQELGTQPARDGLPWNRYVRERLEDASARTGVRIGWLDDLS